jgi:glycerol-3-phosphate dehydrogenase (NAD(P)+)
MSVHLHRAGHTVTLVPRRLEHAAALATTRENTGYLPNVRLHPDIQIASEPAPPLMEADIAVLACPSHGLRALAEKLRPALASARRLRLFVSLVKGLEKDSLLRPSQVLAELLPGRRFGVLSGPTNAGEVVRALPTAVVLASDAEDDAIPVQAAFNSHALRVYRSADVAGVEFGGVLKNIYAIGAGICDGLNLGENAKAAYLSRAIPEMVRLGTAAGGQMETFLGLSGVGDLIATSHGAWSRNRTFGQALAEGNRPADYLASQHTAVEGYCATASFLGIARRHEVHAPVLAAIASILFEGKTPAASVESLMHRLLKVE